MKGRRWEKRKRDVSSINRAGTYTQNRESSVNNDKSKTSMANTEKRREKSRGMKSDLNQGNRLFALGVADASSFIQMEVNKRTGGGSALSKI